MRGACGEIRLHPIQPVDGVLPGLINVRISVVVVDRICDEGHRAVGVIEHCEVGREEERGLWHIRDIRIGVRDPFPMAHRIVGHVPHHAPGERR